MLNNVYGRFGKSGFAERRFYTRLGRVAGTVATISTDQTSQLSDSVFISYSRQDKSFVNDYLIRLLKAASVSFTIDDQDFEVGVPLEESIRKSVNECRYVLLVMTPEWVRGKWTHYEAELALKTANDDTRLRLAAESQGFTVPGEISPRLFLDLCEARNRDQEVIKLLRDLKVPEDKIDQAIQSVARKPSWFLIELLAEPEAHQVMSTINSLLAEIQHSNEILNINKQLHDDMQDLQMLKRLGSRTFNQSNFGEDAQAWDYLRPEIAGLCKKLQHLVANLAAIDPELVDVKRIHRSFEGLAEELKRSHRSCDARKLRDNMNRLSVFIDRFLPQANSQIVAQVKQRRVTDLVEKLGRIYELVADIEFDEAASGLLEQFRRNIEGLVELEETIQQRVDDHETLQDAEVELNLCSPEDEPSIDDIQRNWPRVEHLIDDLKLTQRYDELLKYAGELKQLFGNTEHVRNDEFERTVKRTFEYFVEEMSESFNRLDKDLLTDCGKLKPQSDELKNLLDRMQDNVNQT